MTHHSELPANVWGAIWTKINTDLTLIIYFGKIFHVHKCIITYQEHIWGIQGIPPPTLVIVFLRFLGNTITSGGEYVPYSPEVVLMRILFYTSNLNDIFFIYRGIWTNTPNMNFCIPPGNINGRVRLAHGVE